MKKAFAINNIALQYTVLWGTNVTFWCYYITVDTATDASQNSACTYQITKDVPYNSLVLQCFLKIWNKIKLHFRPSGQKLFCNSIITQYHIGHSVPSGLDYIT
jgi:hypothetical protein